eukprot:5999140-Amphidinium_carterae.1
MCRRHLAGQAVIRTARSGVKRRSEQPQQANVTADEENKLKSKRYPGCWQFETRRIVRTFVIARWRDAEPKWDATTVQKRFDRKVPFCKKAEGRMIHGSTTAIPEEGTSTGHDFCDDIDYAEEDHMIDEAEGTDREVDEYDPNEDDDVRYEYAERRDANVERPSPWYQKLKDYIPVGGINVQHLLNKKKWEIIVQGLRRSGFVGMDLPLEFKLKPGKGRHV